ncbi:hypothetical protein AB833_26865 [Chromatiales bacterium (ex Bugula neritina AB1)]|nr:hypothetical protein AB833_26865 [Chromatiales bacterium (ex Bugula neritina AB1)]
MRISAVYAALFWVTCLGVVYLPEWLRQTGLDTGQIGVVLASASWLKIPVTLAAGNLADHLGRRKRVLLITAGLLACVLPVFFFIKEYFWLCVVWAIAGALASTCVPVADSIAVTAVRRDNAKYGRMRVWGSISFLTGSILCGWIISKLGGNTLVWLLCIAALLLVVSIALAPDYRTKKPNYRGLMIMPVLKIPGFAIFLFAAAMIMASHSALYSLSTVYWSANGIELSVIGLLWATGVVAEILIFYIAAPVQRVFNPWGLLLVASAVAIGRWLLTAVVTEPLSLFFIQSLHAITFTFTQLAVVGFIAREIPEELTSSAQTIYDSCAIGLIFGLALFVSGQLSRVSIGLSFYAMALMALVGFAFALWQIRRLGWRAHA